MMGVSVGDAKRLTYWEFTAMRHEWNERHQTEDQAEAVDAPDVEFVRQRQRELHELGIAGTKH